MLRPSPLNFSRPSTPVLMAVCRVRPVLVLNHLSPPNPISMVRGNRPRRAPRPPHHRACPTLSSSRRATPSCGSVSRSSSPSANQLAMDSPGCCRATTQMRRGGRGGGEEQEEVEEEAGEGPTCERARARVCVRFAGFSMCDTCMRGAARVSTHGCSGAVARPPHCTQTCMAPLRAVPCHAAHNRAHPCRPFPHLHQVDIAAVNRAAQHPQPHRRPRSPCSPGRRRRRPLQAPQQRCVSVEGVGREEGVVHHVCRAGLVGDCHHTAGGVVGRGRTVRGAGRAAVKPSRVRNLEPRPLYRKRAYDHLCE